MKRILIFLLLTSAANGATYYTDDVTGNDTNDGSAGSPWETIPKIGDSRGGNTFNEGDTCFIKNYTGGGFYAGYLKSEDTVRSSYTKYINFPGHSPKIDWIYIDKVGANQVNRYFWFEGLTVVGDRLAPKYKVFWGGHYLVLKDMTIQGDGYVEGEGIGFKSTNSNFIRFDGCTFNGAVDEPQGGEYHAIAMTTCSDVDVIDCDISRYAIALIPSNTSGASGCKRWNIQGNRIHDMDSDGMFGSDWEDFDIIENEFYNITPPIIATLTGEYTYTDSTRTLTRTSGDVFESAGNIAIPTNKVRITSTADGLIPPVDPCLPAVAYPRYVPSIATRVDEDNLIMSNAGGLDYGQDYSDITKVEIYRDYHADGIQTSDTNPNKVLMNNVRIERNIFHDITHFGMLLKSVTATSHLGTFYVKNNVFYNCAVAIQCEDVTGLYLNNNTIAGYHGSEYDATETDGRVLLQDGTTVAEMYNNVFDAVSGDITDAIPLHDNNIYFSMVFSGIGSYTPGGNDLDLSTLAELKALFTDYDNKDYTLSSDSAALNFGDSTYAPDTDIDDTTRGCPPDAGAYDDGIGTCGGMRGRYSGGSARGRYSGGGRH